MKKLNMSERNKLSEKVETKKIAGDEKANIKLLLIENEMKAIE